MKIPEQLFKHALFVFLVFGMGFSLLAQTPAIESSAELELRSTTQGFLPPRMTVAQRNAITGTATGLIIYNTDAKKLNFWDGIEWREIAIISFKNNTEFTALTPTTVSGGDMVVNTTSNTLNIRNEGNTGWYTFR